MLASEYGITIKQFGEMTAREVFICMERISKRKKGDLLFQAKLHGAEIKQSAFADEKMKITKEQDEMLTKHLELLNKERFGK